MKRVIEDLTAKRQACQEKLKQTLGEVSRHLRGSLWGRRKAAAAIDHLHNELCELITAQDREWDALANNHSTMVFKSLEWKIDKLEAEYSNVRTLLVNFIQLETALEKLIASVQDKTDEETIRKLQNVKERLSPYQYGDFEQRFRGDSATVRQKLRQYLDRFSGRDDILDIGCGRGEFLALLTEAGKRAQGIDISASMLDQARDRGCTCQHQDALEFLRQQPDEAFGGIFSSQVIEHFAPDYLRQVVLECRRVLQKDSPLLLETINPLSLFALSRIFFLDPSHRQPLHPEFMRYLLESSGFQEVAILFTDDLPYESLETVDPILPLALPFNRNVDRLNRLLYSAPEYAITGMKR